MEAPLSISLSKSGWRLFGLSCSRAFFSHFVHIWISLSAYGRTAWNRSLRRTVCWAYHGESIERHIFHRPHHECLINSSGSLCIVSNCFISTVFSPSPQLVALHIMLLKCIGSHSTPPVLDGPPGHPPAVTSVSVNPHELTTRHLASPPLIACTY